MHEQAVRRGAGLAAVAEFREQRPLDGQVEVGVLEDEERRVAAELHRDAEHLVGGVGDQATADFGRSRERQLAQPRVLDQRARHPAGARRGDDVQHAGRQAGLLEHLREEQRRERGERGGLQHHGASGRDRRGDLAGGHREREVPRRDEQARTDGPLGDEQPAAAVGRGREPAGDAGGLLREPAQELRAVRDLAARLGERLAHLERHQERELVGASGDRLERAPQDLGALTRCRASP